jgi:hypothetical protein
MSGAFGECMTEAVGVTVDRTLAGRLATLHETTDKRRKHLEGLTGEIVCEAMGVVHVLWPNGEMFALTENDEWEDSFPPEETEHDLGRCLCDMCDEDRAEAGWSRARRF